MRATLKGDVVEARLWLPVEEIEEAALNQLRNIASLPWAAHVAVMPDCHFGKGATVGSVIATRAAVSPAAVGVDIGCGMAAMKTSLKATNLPDSLKSFRRSIEAAIPVGHNSHRNPVPINGFAELFSSFHTLDSGVQGLFERSMLQLGTLGGGNHFIEVCLDTDQNVWIMLHSGSRHIGNVLAEIHIERARKLSHNQELPDPDLAVFLAGTPEMQTYRHDLMWAQRYATTNRLTMLHLCRQVLRSPDFYPFVEFQEPIMCHHNYVAEEVHFGEDLLVTRKGAISAKVGELGIIPGSMGTSSYIVRGLGNPDSLCSASHGAGRRMSRNAARRMFSAADLEEQTRGVECRKDEKVIDEIPGAYKPIEQVIEYQKDLVEVVTQLKQVLCVKG